MGKAETTREAPNVWRRASGTAFAAVALVLAMASLAWACTLHAGTVVVCHIGSIRASACNANTGQPVMQLPIWGLPNNDHADLRDSVQAGGGETIRITGSGLPLTEYAVAFGDHPSDHMNCASHAVETDGRYPWGAGGEWFTVDTTGATTTGGVTGAGHTGAAGTFVTLRTVPSNTVSDTGWVCLYETDPLIDPYTTLIAVPFTLL